MPDYDFHQLSPYDLEILVRDLLQAHWGVTIESFKTGRDGGVDLRYADGPDRTIVQVKHHLRTGVRGFMRVLGAEAVNVRRLRPQRYVVATSVGLTWANKDEVVRIIGPGVMRAQDVFGAEDLNNLLGLHPDIEARHFKLWLASRTILDRVIANAAVTRSEFKARKVYEQARRYVPGSAFPMARKVLNDERVVIIAGPPGVGKTTLADLLLYEHLSRGYQAVLIQGDVVEGEQLFQVGKRQVFHFDDFMGATFAGDRFRIGGTVDGRALLTFIAMVRDTPTARLILTTREHVYAQALGRSERLRAAGLADLKVMLNMPAYSVMDRARILYNHIHFSELPQLYRDELVKGDFFKTIIKHEKFNPRLIEWLSNHRRLRAVPVARYRAFVEDLLRDPSEIWRHAYEQELTEAGRSVLLAMWSLGGQAGGQALRSAFAPLHRRRAGRYNFLAHPEDFRSGLREVANSFVKPTRYRTFAVINPSVLDLMNAVVRSAPDNAVDVIVGADDFSQVEQVWKVAKAQRGEDVLNRLMRQAGELAPKLGELAMLERQVTFDADMTDSRGLGLEHRLAVILDMVQVLSSADIAALVRPVMDRLSVAWHMGHVSIDGCLGALHRLEWGTCVPDTDVERHRAALWHTILGEVRKGCRADELRDVLNAMDENGREDSCMAAVRAGFERFEGEPFYRDLHGCRSRDNFDTLVEDLELFAEMLGVDVGRLVEQVLDAKSEFDEYKDLHEDQMQDDWSERQDEVLNVDREMVGLFGSLNREDE